MKDKPLVSIIILNYNGKLFLDKCLSSIFETKYPSFEVVLVDNASTDASLIDAEKRFGMKSLKVIRNAKNVGFGPGNNVGFKYAAGDYIAFLNYDTAVDPDWLGAMVDVMEEDPTIGLAQSMLFNMNDRKLQCAGWLVSDYWVCLYCIGSTNKDHCDLWPDVFEISYAAGASMIAKRELLQEIGLFDPKYLFFYDDTYISFKTWLAGKRVVTISRSKVYHVGSGVSRVGAFFTKRHNTICLLSMIFDVYWNLQDLTKALFAFAFNLITFSLKEIVEQKTISGLRGDISAIFWIVKNLKYVWKNRLKYRNKAKIDEKTLRKRMIRIHIPTSVYFVPPPAKLLASHLESEIRRVCNRIIGTGTSK